MVGVSLSKQECLYICFCGLFVAVPCELLMVLEGCCAACPFGWSPEELVTSPPDHLFNVHLRKLTSETRFVIGESSL